MSKTKPSGWPIVPPEDATVWIEVAQVDGQRRLNLLPRWTARFQWLRATKTTHADVLLVFSEPGKIKLLPWSPHGEKVLGRYHELSQAEQTAATLEALRLIQDKYGRLLIDDEHRPYLGDAALTHLGCPLDRGVKSTVYVTLYPDCLVIMSTDLRNAALLQGIDLLDDLPQ